MSRPERTTDGKDELVKFINHTKFLFRFWTVYKDSTDSDKEY